MTWVSISISCCRMPNGMLKRGSSLRGRQGAIRGTVPVHVDHKGPLDGLVAEAALAPLDLLGVHGLVCQCVEGDLLVSTQAGGKKNFGRHQGGGSGVGVGWGWGWGC